MPNARHMLRQALQDFVFSLSQGAQAAAKTPGVRGGQASLAASLGAPALRQEMIRTRQQEDQDRTLKVQQIQDAIKRGEFNDAERRFNIMKGMPAPEQEIPAVRTPQGIELTPAQTSVAPLPPVNIPGMGMISPPSAQSMAQQDIAKQTALETMRTNQNIRQTNETRVPPTDTSITPFDVWQKQNPGKPIQEWIELNRPKPSPTERNQQSRDIQRGGKEIRQYFDGSDPSKVTFEVELGSVKDKTDDPLTTAQRNNTFLNISNKYQADAIVNQSIKGQTAKAIADQIIKDPSKATNQLAALYLYVKNLDADSAVREGEIGLARQTQSYFQTWGTSLARINSGQVISPAAAKELAKATKDLVTAWEATAKTRTSQYKSQAATAGVGPQFDQYLAGFATIQGGGNSGGSENRTRIKF